MASDDPETPAAVTRTSKHQAELNRLGRNWFAEVREQSDQEKAELEAWQREHNKWSAFNRRSGGVDPDFD